MTLLMFAELAGIVTDTPVVGVRHRDTQLGVGGNSQQVKEENLSEKAVSSLRLTRKAPSL
jgi:hypothetical protein